MSNANGLQLERVVPMTEIADALSCTPITARRTCDRHDVPITRLSAGRIGLTMSNYALLLRRTTKTGKAG